MTSRTTRQKIGMLLPLLFVAFVAGVSATHAAASDNLSGYAWSSNIGWISFNCTNTGICATSPYGVTVAANGTLSGYAWSPNVGWISFNAADVVGCPSGACTPQFSKTTGQVTGWARALAGASAANGGWDGWVHLSGTGYGIVATGCNWGGYAWGGGPNAAQSVIGWINTSGTGYGVVGTGNACVTPLPTATLTAFPITINAGGSSKLTWSSNAASCTGTGFSTGGAASNATGVTVNPGTTSTYQINCGSAFAQATVTVTTPNVSISADPSRVTKGGTTAITWNATGVNSCDITRNGQAWKSGLTGANLSSSSTDNITSQTTYVISCTGGGGAATTATQIVNVVSSYSEF